MVTTGRHCAWTALLLGALIVTTFAAGPGEASAASAAEIDIGADAAIERFRKEVGEHARAYITKHHSLENTARQYYEFLQTIVERRSQAEPLRAVSCALHDLGIHSNENAILEDVVSTLSKCKGGFAQLTEAELLENLHESCGRIATRLGSEGVMSDARNAYMLRRSASYLARILRSRSAQPKPDK